MNQINMIKKPYELEPPRGIKSLIYSPPGFGKTTLGLSAPAPLLFDFDDGTHRVLAQHLKDTMQVKTWVDVVDCLDGKRGPIIDFKTYVFDTASKLLNCMNMHIVKYNPKHNVQKSGALTQQGYGVRKQMFNQFVANISNAGVHLVFLCQMAEEIIDEEKYFRPKVGGSSGDDLIQDLDLVGHMEAKGDQRIISFDPNEKYYGKNSCGLPSETILLNPDSNPNNFLTGVFEQYEKNAAVRVEMSKEYNLLIQIITTDIEAIQTAENANTFITGIEGYQHIWDSKKQASRALKLKAKSLKLVFDKENKCYTDPEGEGVERDKGPAATAETGATPAADVKKAAAKRKADDKKIQTEFNKLCKACKTKPSVKTMDAVDQFWNKHESIRANDKNADQLIDLQHELETAKAPAK